IADSADPNQASYQVSVEHLADWIATRGYATS
ncbi:C39 family peptidase, partial [Micromonospora taraxaci]